MLWCFSVWFCVFFNQTWVSQSVTSLDFVSPQTTSVSSEDLSPSGSFDGQLHVMQCLTRNWWDCFGQLRLELSAADLRGLFHLAVHQSKIRLYCSSELIIHPKTPKWKHTDAHTLRDPDKNLIRSLDKAVPALYACENFFPGMSYIIQYWNRLKKP